MRGSKIFWLAGLVILLGCSEKKPTEVTITDQNQDRVWHVPPDSILGNVDVWFIPGTLQGSAIWLINGPGRAVGLDVTNADDRSTVYFGDGYTGAGKNHAETGTTIPIRRWIYVRVVVYRTLSGVIQEIIEALGAGFFDRLEDAWIEGVYEAKVYLDYGSGQSGVITSGWQDVTSQYLSR